MAQNNPVGTHIVTDGAVGSRVYVGNTTPAYPVTGDLWIDNSSGSVPTLNLTTFTASGGETSVTATYTVGTEAVFLNGAKLIGGGVDYTASNGSSITGLTALVAGDVVQVQSFQSSTVSGTVPLSTVTTAGDLIVGSGSSTVTRLGIGASGTLLTSNGSTATWAAAPATGFTGFFLMGA
jgi:hypothetical protein